MVARVALYASGIFPPGVYDYEIPTDFIETLKPAMRVAVPFGKSNKTRQAFVVSIHLESEYKNGLKPIIDILDDEPIVPLHLVESASFIAREYFCSLTEALACVVPQIAFAPKKKPKQEACYEITQEALLTPGYGLAKGGGRQQAAMALLAEAVQPMPFSLLGAESGISKKSLESLEKNGLVARSQIVQKPKGQPVKPHLTDAQQKAVNGFFEARAAGCSEFLLYGVTGSGKTNVFFEIFERIIEGEGAQCLMLVPEISLTPQMVGLIERRFGTSVVAFHSRQSASKRQEAYDLAKSGSPQVFLGARSALFLPFTNIGAIVIDEEHEASYKSSLTPRYETGNVALNICKLTGACLIYSSATPSIQTFYKAKTGQCGLLELPERISGNLPEVEIIDMRKELYTGNRSTISRALAAEISEALDRKEQSLLYLNRRGHSTYMFCRDCGYVEECPNCSVSLTLHESGRPFLTCHYCGFRKNAMENCPSCSSPRFRKMGTGTQKIEQDAKALFPNARIMRLDSDTAKAAGSYQAILDEFALGGIDILVGTQMVAKGHDFSNVGLVGIMLAESTLSIPDLNSPARAFQLATQAAGRAGRRGGQAKVLMQTYQPENSTLVFASQHDYEGFYAYDISHRQSSKYPPFTEIAGFYIANEDDEKCMADAAKVHEALVSASGKSARVLPASPNRLHKLKGKYIWQVMAIYHVPGPFKTAALREYNTLRAKILSTLFVEVNPSSLI
ncbi:MAG: primosomal protein N' [Eubacteriaceae bacterium]|nr:primosomal protein N' [Eubacteriaceae bacterium]